MHGYWPRTWMNELYQLNSKMQLSFLARLDSTYFNAEKAQSYVQRLESEWINYDVKLRSP